MVYFTVIHSCLYDNAVYFCVHECKTRKVKSISLSGINDLVSQVVG